MWIRKGKTAVEFQDLKRSRQKLLQALYWASERIVTKDMVLNDVLKHEMKRKPWVRKGYPNTSQCSRTLYKRIWKLAIWGYLTTWNFRWVQPIWYGKRETHKMGPCIIIHTFTNYSQSATLLRKISVSIDRTFLRAATRFFSYHFYFRKEEIQWWENLDHMNNTNDLPPYFYTFHDVCFLLVFLLVQFLSQKRGNSMIRKI